MVYRSVTLVIDPCKTAEPIDIMPFPLWSRVGPWNHVFDRVPEKGAIVRGRAGGPYLTFHFIGLQKSSLHSIITIH